MNLIWSHMQLTDAKHSDSGNHKPSLHSQNKLKKKKKVIFRLENKQKTPGHTWWLIGHMMTIQSTEEDH